MPRQRRAEPAAPPLLAKLYGEGNVLCLRDMLLRLAGLSNEAAALPTALVQPHDHADYSCVSPWLPGMPLSINRPSFGSRHCLSVWADGAGDSPCPPHRRH